jgi:hypothetical protein
MMGKIKFLFSFSMFISFSHFAKLLSRLPQTGLASQDFAKKMPDPKILGTG